MKNISAQVLEFGALRDLLRGYSASDLGRSRVSGLAPSIDLFWIQNQQQLTSEIREFRRVGGNFNFAGLLDPAELLAKAHISGAILEPQEILQVSDGSLYPALHKLEHQGWIKSEWKQTENNRRAKFYSLTRLGKAQLGKESAAWERLSAAISRVVRLEEV